MKIYYTFFFLLLISCKKDKVTPEPEEDLFELEVSGTYTGLLYIINEDIDANPGHFDTLDIIIDTVTVTQIQNKVTITHSSAILFPASHDGSTTHNITSDGTFFEYSNVYASDDPSYNADPRFNTKKYWNFRNDSIILKEEGVRLYHPVPTSSSSTWWWDISYYGKKV